MQITYTNKEALQNDPEVLDKNKVTAEDMNEIKTVVNSNEEEQQSLILATQANTQDISDLQDEQEEQNETIEALQEELAEIKAENEDLKNNQLTGEESGQSIYLSDSADSRVRSIGLNGNSEQESTTGSQLFDIGTSASDYSNSLGNSLIVNDKSIQMKVLASGETITYRTQNLTSNKKYTISGNATIVYSRLFIRMRKNDDSGWLTNNDTSIEGWVYNAYYQGWYKENTTKTINQTVTIPECMYWQLGFGFNSINEYIGTTQSISEITLNTGETALPWEKYTGGQASPNPNYPQEIHSTGDNVNLFDKDNAIDGKEINNAITGQIGNGPNWFITDYIGVIPNNTYVVSGKANGAAICYYNANKEFVSGSATGGNSGFTVPNDNNIKYVILNGLINQKDTFKLEQGDKATPYSPYGCGNVNEKVQNKNLFDGVFDNSSGSTITLITKNTDIILPAGTYTVSFINKTIGLQSNANIYSGTTNILSLNWYQDVKQLVLTEKTRITKITCDVPANTIIYCQLEQGTATDYTAHEEQDYSIPTQQPMRAIGEYKDTFVKVDGNWYERHYIAEVILDGSRVWNKSSGYSNEKYFCGFLDAGISNTIDGSFALNDSFQIGLYTRILDEECMSNNYQFNVRILASRLSENSVEGFKQWLSTHNVKAYGRYVTPLDLPCTEEQVQALENLEKARTYKPVTHISSTDEVPATVDITYVKDLETVINNISSAVVALGGEVNV